MEIYTSEQEQIDELKKWWSENGRAVILGIIIGAVGLLGWDSWNRHQTGIAENASELYTTVMTELEAGQLARIDGYADQMAKDFADTPYASLAALAAAKANVTLGKNEEAKKRLLWVLEHSDLKQLTAVANLRLVNIYLSGSEYEQADKILSQAFPDSFMAAVDELKGDLLVAKGSAEEAKVAYDRALASEIPTQKRQLIQLKRDELGSNNKPVNLEPSA